MVETIRGPRVLLAGLAPLAAVGMRQSLSGDGVEIVGQEDRPLAIEALARSLAPDAVVMGLESCGSRSLCERVRVAAPLATVILWAAEENRMEVIAPGEGAVREVATGELVELRREVLASKSRSVRE